MFGKCELCFEETELQNTYFIPAGVWKSPSVGGAPVATVLISRVVTPS
jgi:hypothetical protein